MLVGNTRLACIDGIFCKLERENPTGSIKDRMAQYMVRRAEAEGLLQPGQRIIEATSGNTGIALAMLAQMRGYRFTAVMPESMSIERVRLMQHYGAEVIRTPAAEDVGGAVRRFEELAAADPAAWCPRQFENPWNIQAHRISTALELYLALPNIDVVLAGVGTGGTLLGIAQGLRDHGLAPKIVAIEPTESAVLSGGHAGLHKIQGIGEGFIPKIVQDRLDWIDEVITVSSSEALAMRAMLAHQGYQVGISSGANFAGALEARTRWSGTIVTLFPDDGARYCS